MDTRALVAGIFSALVSTAWNGTMARIVAIEALHNRPCGCLDRLLAPAFRWLQRPP